MPASDEVLTREQAAAMRDTLVTVTQGRVKEAVLLWDSHEALRAQRENCHEKLAVAQEQLAASLAREQKLMGLLGELYGYCGKNYCKAYLRKMKRLHSLYVDCASCGIIRRELAVVLEVTP